MLAKWKEGRRERESCDGGGARRGEGRRAAALQGSSTQSTQHDSHSAQLSGPLLGTSPAASAALLLHPATSTHTASFHCLGALYWARRTPRIHNHTLPHCHFPGPSPPSSPHHTSPVKREPEPNLFFFLSLAPWLSLLTSTAQVVSFLPFLQSNASSPLSLTFPLLVRASLRHLSYISLFFAANPGVSLLVPPGLQLAQRSLSSSEVVTKPKPPAATS